jgi:hypothetical protein
VNVDICFAFYFTLDIAGGLTETFLFFKLDIGWIVDPKYKQYVKIK